MGRLLLWCNLILIIIIVFCNGQEIEEKMFPKLVGECYQIIGTLKFNTSENNNQYNVFLTYPNETVKNLMCSFNMDCTFNKSYSEFETECHCTVINSPSKDPLFNDTNWEIKVRVKILIALSTSLGIITIQLHNDLNNDVDYNWRIPLAITPMQDSLYINGVELLTTPDYSRRIQGRARSNLNYPTLVYILENIHPLLKTEVIVDDWIWVKERNNNSIMKVYMYGPQKFMKVLVKHWVRDTTLKLIYYEITYEGRNRSGEEILMENADKMYKDFGNMLIFMVVGMCIMMITGLIHLIKSCSSSVLKEPSIHPPPYNQPHISHPYISHPLRLPRLCHCQNYSSESTRNLLSCQEE